MDERECARQLGLCARHAHPATDRHWAVAATAVARRSDYNTLARRWITSLEIGIARNMTGKLRSA